VSVQTAVGKKGAALREAATIARRLPPVSARTWLCWQEPEKVDMARHWVSTLRDAHSADVLVPAREPTNFAATYPIEQFHSETYGNLYLDACAKAAQAGTTSKIPPLDWHFGPFAFRAEHLELWAKYNGVMYEAQVVPIVHAMRKGLSVASVSIGFDAPSEMKDQEEGNVEFIEKRLQQLQSLDPVVKAAWTDPFYS